jgi:hypothetical protein
MHFLNIALAAAGLLGSSLAAPAAAVADNYHWSVTNWTSTKAAGRGYDYTFTVTGKKNGVTPKFTATCTGTSKDGYSGCTVTTPADVKVSANVDIITNSATKHPRIYVHTEYSNGYGCVDFYEFTGHHDGPTIGGGASDTEFPIYPEEKFSC